MNTLFGCVHGDGTDGETSDGGNVTGSTTLCLNDEDTTTRGSSRLLDGIAVVDQSVQASIATNGVFGTRNVVGNSCGKNDDRDLEGIVVASGLAKLRDGGESLETTNDEESVNLVVGKSIRDTVVVLGGSSTVGTDFGTTLAGPVLGIEPLDLTDGALLILVVAGEAGEAVVQSDRCVAAGETVGGGGTGGSVHTTGGSSDVNNTNTETL